MKKTLLLVALSLPVLGLSQSLTQANEPAILTTESMHLCDSFTVKYDGIVGMGVTWDYTILAGYPGQFRDVSVVDATTTTYASDFAGATFALNVGTNLTSLISSSSLPPAIA